MPEPLPAIAALPSRRGGYVVTLLLCAAGLAQGLAAVAIHHQRGTATIYAFQSPDAGEYVNLARGLARHGQYAQFDAEGRRLSGPDVWRMPGYPLFLAAIIKLGGDSPRVLLLAQEVLAALSVPLLWLILRRLTRPHWAVIAALAWCFDPFRLYYGLWLMSETLFVFVMLVAGWVWIEFSGFSFQGSTSGASNTRPPLPRGGCGGVNEVRESIRSTSIRNPKSEIRNGPIFLLGLLSGLLVLIRPIASPLPLLTLIGVTVASCRPIRNPKSEIRNRLLPVLACLLGITLSLAPWLVRNRVLSGHLALSCQSGASLAYHKVVDVVLWSQGRPEYRFDPATTADVREHIDADLRQLWSRAHPDATPEELQALTWEKLNFGKPTTADPFETSSMLWAIGLEAMRIRPGSTAACFAVQGVGMLIFPLGLTLWPPAGTGSAPFSMLFGGGGGFVAKALPPLIGAAYAGLSLLVLVRLVAAIFRRQWPAGVFALWPLLFMFAFSLPSEDPRFRLPLVPLLWILAVACRGFAIPPAAGSNSRK